jgi:ribosomal protein S27E
VGLEKKNEMDFENNNKNRLVGEYAMDTLPSHCCEDRGKIDGSASDVSDGQGTFLSFRCPECGNYSFFELLSEAMQTTEIHGLHTARGPVRGVEQFQSEEAFHEGYICLECGHWLENPDGTRVISDGELRAYLEGLPVNQGSSR